jgi:tyrosine-protein phosphatase YwqE
MFLLNNLFKKKVPQFSPVVCDMHNHILYGIDDGSKSLEYSIEMIHQMMKLGFKKLIFTPHVISDYYPNNRQTISQPFNALNDYIGLNNLELKVEFAAEHLIDDAFIQDLKSNPENILSFGNKNVLIETPFINQPNQLEQIIFDLFNKGFTPILAHPERYVYLQSDYELMERIFQTGVKFQINLLSLISHYSPQSTKLAKYLIDNKLYHYVSSDAHKLSHIEQLKEVYSSKLFGKIEVERLLNNQLVSE